MRSKMTKTKESAVIICHENPFTSFGRMASYLKQSLSAEYDAEIIWLVTPKYFRPPAKLPPNSYTVCAPDFMVGLFTLGKPLRRLLNELRPAAVILINQFLSFLIPDIRKELANVRVGVFIHDIFAETEHPNIIKRVAIRRIYNPHVADADVFLYNSRYTESEAQRVLKLPSATAGIVVGSPVDRIIFRSLEDDKRTLRQKYGLDGYKGVCLNVSFDNPRKNIKTFFELAKARPEIAFVRIGRLSPWMEEWLAENRVNNVRHFSGLSTEQLPELYCGADLLVFPSFAEGFGAPPLEALACGIPAVAAAGSALEEIFKDAIPLVAPPDNVNGYLEVIDDVMSGKNVVNRNAAEKLVEYYSIENFGNRVRSAIKDQSGKRATGNDALNVNTISDTTVSRNNSTGKVVIVCQSNPMSSFGLMSQYLKKVLSAEFETEILWLVTPQYFPQELSLPSGSRAIHVPNLKLGWWLLRKPFRNYLKEARPQKIIFSNHFPAFLIPEIRRALPNAWVGVFIHDMFTETVQLKSVKRWIHRNFYVAKAKTADGFLYNSDYTRQDAHKVGGYPLNHPAVGFPIDLSVFHKTTGSRAAIKQKWGFENNKGVCLNVSIDNPRKNIKTFFMLAKARPGITFVRVGILSPWMKEWLDENDVRNVTHFSGLSAKSLVELYHCADLVICPSFLEGFGVPPLEALACGVQAVASCTSSFTEILTGVIPLIDPPDNVNGYLEVIDDVMSGKKVVDWNAAGKLLEHYSIESFGGRVRAYLRGNTGRKV